MKIVVLGAGRGGTRQSSRYFLGWSAEERNRLTYAGMDTNGATLRELKEALSAYGINPVTVELPTSDGKCEGSGYDPDVARQALMNKQADLSDILSGSDVAQMFFGYGKGTGEGTSLLATQIALEQRVVPFVVITLPPRPQPNQRMRYKRVLRGFHALGVRPIVIDAAAVQLDPKLRLVSAAESFPVLDEIVGQNLRGGLMPVLEEGSQIDLSDVRTFVFGEGYLVPVYGNYVRPKSEDLATPVTTKAIKDALSAAWRAATPPYYAKGRSVSRALVSLSGDWNQQEEGILEGLVCKFHRCTSKFQIINARFRGDQNQEGFAFSVLFAAEPDETETSQEKVQVAVAEGAQLPAPAPVAIVAPQAAAPQSVLSKGAPDKVKVNGRAVLAPPKVLTPLPTSSPVVVPTPVEEDPVDLLHRKVFNSRNDPGAITFRHFLSSVRGISNPLTYKMLEGTPSELEEQMNEIIVRIRGEEGPRYALTYDQISPVLMDMLNPEVVGHVSDSFRLHIAEQAKAKGICFSPKFTVRSTSGRVFTVDLENPGLDKLFANTLDAKSHEKLIALKYLRPLLGPEIFSSLVNQSSVGNQDGRTSVFSRFLANAREVGSKFVDPN